MTNDTSASDQSANARPALSAERWTRVQDIFDAAIGGDASHRAALLDRACGDDAAVRAEVESLLDGHDRPGPVDHLVDRLATAISEARTFALGWEGRPVGSYVVLSTLGGGAMGVVYKARDERLGRYVALKFLPPHLGTNAEAKRRFLLEARAAATFDHPNICTIHEIGETADGQLFIAMPLYDGETLQARLGRGPLCCADAVGIARQIADGLQQAHQRGVVHRDIKPSNIMLLTDGTVKILDFGVAKVEDVPLTDGDSLLGTLAYMSPEQARGHGVDARTDIWSVGVVLYEMLAGTRPFRGATRQALIEAICTRDPEPLDTWRADLPATIDDVMRKALARSPDARYGSMAAMAADLVGAIDRRRSVSGASFGAAFGASSASPLTQAHEAQSIAAGAERRWTAVLVSVVSDDGTLVERMAPDALDRLIDEIRGCAAEIVRRHCGLVHKPIGDEIISLFGVPVAHEDDDVGRCARRSIPTAAIRPD